jgi:hypothetical protein
MEINEILDASADGGAQFLRFDFRGLYLQQGVITGLQDHHYRRLFQFQFSGQTRKLLPAGNLTVRFMEAATDQFGCPGTAVPKLGDGDSGMV